MHLLGPDELLQIASRLTALLSRLFGGEDAGPLSRSLHRYVMSGGKRLRPQLCVWTFRQLAPSLRAADQPLTDALLDVACAWEFFHAFLLAHDDIIDGADCRRGRPSLHRQLESLDGKSARFGANLGIVAGDLLFAGALRALHEVDLPAAVYRDVLRLFSRVAGTTGFGQASDILQSHMPTARLCEKQVLSAYYAKTAAYTFEGPMISGGLLAGAGPDQCAAVSRFALALGQAYQLHNDLLDLMKQAHAGCDLIEGKRTISLLRARESMPAVQRGRFDEQLSALRTANGSAVALAEELRRELLDAGAVEKTNELIFGFLDAARAAAGEACLPAGLACGMGGLAASFERDYFTPAIPLAKMAVQ